MSNIIGKETDKYILHYKHEDKSKHTEEFHFKQSNDIRREMSDEEAKQYFKDILKKFNYTLRPHEKKRIFVKVERGYETIIYKKI